jgi:FlaA1/EpsC-like NDP-sugar epimerase
VTLASVRFGNVLGSRGSFLSVLADQIARDQPVTVTHPDVSRFFMTVEEAVGLVLETAAMAEYAETFVLDMGEPVQIVSLVRNYAEQLKVPNVEIRYTGLRPGEKLAEKVFSDAEERVPSAHPKIWATRCTEPSADFGPLLDRLYAAADDGDSAQAKELLRLLVPEYEPSERLETPVSVGAPYPDGF